MLQINKWNISELNYLPWDHVGRDFKCKVADLMVFCELQRVILVKCDRYLTCYNCCPFISSPFTQRQLLRTHGLWANSFTQPVFQLGKPGSYSIVVFCLRPVFIYVLPSGPEDYCSNSGIGSTTPTWKSRSAIHSNCRPLKILSLRIRNVPLQKSIQVFQKHKKLKLETVKTLNISDMEYLTGNNRSNCDQNRHPNTSMLIVA